jgi:hypothetical protein
MAFMIFIFLEAVNIALRLNQLNYLMVRFYKAPFFDGFFACH